MKHPLPPWQEPVRGGHPDSEALSLPGIEQLRGILEGSAPRPPLSHLTGMRLVDVGDGTAAFELPLSDWLRSPQGPVSIGPLTMPADGAMACAILSVLAPGVRMATSELSLRLLSPPAVGGTVTARGRVIEVKRTLALADAELRDEQGSLVAHGSSLCSLVAPAADARAQTSDPGPATAGPAPRVDGSPTTPDPWERPAQGQVISQHEWDQMSGLEVLRAQIDGRLPQSPIHYLTGLAVTAASQGSVTVSMPASPWLCAPPPGRVQGGMTATLAEAALSAAIQTLLPPRTALAPIDLKVNYLRPLAADGNYAVARGTVVHLGRRLAVATAEVDNAEGKPVAIATGSAVLLAGRPAALPTPNTQWLST